MAKHTPAKHPERVDDALSPTLRAALQEIAELLDLAEGAALIQSIEITFTTAAAAGLVRKLEKEAGLSRRAAVEVTAARFGLEPETLRSRLESWPRKARGLWLA